MLWKPMMLGAPAPFFSMVPHQLCSCYYIDAVVRVEESGAPLAHVCWMKKAYPTPHCRRSILKTTCYCWYFLSDCTYCYFSGCRFLQIASCRFCRFLQKDDGRWHFATQRKWLLRFFQASNFKGFWKFCNSHCSLSSLFYSCFAMLAYFQQFLKA